MGDDAGRQGDTQTLIDDYEQVAALRIKRTVELATVDAGARASLQRLIAAGIVLQIHGAIVLMRPDDWNARPDHAHVGRLHETYLGWLRTDYLPDSVELLYGEPGFWQHLWNRIRERDYTNEGPLMVDFVVPDDGTFSARTWLTEFDPQIRAHILDGGLVRGRVIFPPDSIKSAVEPMLDLVAESGLAVRVLSTEASFVLYDSATAILNKPQRSSDDNLPHLPEPYWAVRSDAIAGPLQLFFDVLWESATPYRAHRGEYDEILELLGRGWTDAQITESLSVSPRTLSRRVAEIMDDFGVSSRFELGVRYERSRVQR